MGTFEITEAAAISVVRVMGEVDASQADEIDAALTGLVRGQATVVVDLEQAALIDSAVVSRLIQAAQDAAQASCRLVIAAPCQGMPRKILRIAGLDDRLPLYESCDDALRALRSDWIAKRSFSASDVSSRRPSSPIATRVGHTAITRAADHGLGRPRPPPRRPRLARRAPGERAHRGNRYASETLPPHRARPHAAYRPATRPPTPRDSAPAR